MIIKNHHKKNFFYTRPGIIVCLSLVLSILVAYWQVRDHEFVNYDDDLYVTKNQHVQAGLSLKGITWSLTDTSTGNWHPLTWLSHMLDCQLYGMNPGSHHLTSVLFHMWNTLLLFLLLRRMTGALWQSGFVATLFALHPLHVESVAWVAERKDVLSTFFWMLTLWSYVWYVEHRGISRYLLVLLFFILGLMAKPMLVTLPFVLLLLDYWPLKRFSWEKSVDGNLQQESTISRMIWEKTPLFFLAMALSVVTFLAQKSGGALNPLDVYPLDARIGNAVVSYVSYIGKMIWPNNLAILYPHPGMLPIKQVAGAGLLILFISLLAIWAVKRRPWFTVGWLWYTGTLVPVIGLVQVGVQSMADRYTYVPLIGLFIIVAWGIHELMARWRHRIMGLLTMTALFILILLVITRMQVRYWSNSISLFEHAIKVTDGNFVAHNNLGKAFSEKGRIAEAITHFLEALRIKPDYAEAHNNLGLSLAKNGRIDEAIKHILQALQLKPYFAEAHNNLGNALDLQRRTGEAIGHYLEALRIKPDFEEAHYNLGLVLVRQNRTDEAITHFLEALRIKPDYAEANNDLGLALFHKGNIEGAIDHFREALRIKPDFVEALNNISLALANHGRINEAIRNLFEALRIKPDYAETHNNLGVVLIRRGNIKGAIDHFQEALRIKPDYVQAKNNLNQALMSQQQDR